MASSSRHRMHQSRCRNPATFTLSFLSLPSSSTPLPESSLQVLNNVRGGRTYCTHTLLLFPCQLREINLVSFLRILQICIAKAHGVCVCLSTFFNIWTIEAGAMELDRYNEHQWVVTPKPYVASTYQVERSGRNLKRQEICMVPHRPGSRFVMIN